MRSDVPNRLPQRRTRHFNFAIPSTQSTSNTRVDEAVAADDDFENYLFNSNHEPGLKASHFVVEFGRFLKPCRFDPDISRRLTFLTRFDYHLLFANLGNYSLK